MTDHSLCVDALMERAGDRLLAVFDAAFDALWRRAQTTLGDVTLMAIVKRVLHKAAERYPVFQALQLTPAGIDHEELHSRLGHLNREPMESALRFVLVELLTVIGLLTAEILTPALHEALLNVASTYDSAPVPAVDALNARSQENAT